MPVVSSLLTREGAAFIIANAPDNAAFRVKIKNAVTYVGQSHRIVPQVNSFCSLHISRNQAVAIVKDFFSDAAEREGARVPMAETMGARGRVTYIIG